MGPGVLKSDTVAGCKCSLSKLGHTLGEEVSSREGWEKGGRVEGIDANFRNLWKNATAVYMYIYIYIYARGVARTILFRGMLLFT